MLTETPVLAYFDHGHEVVLQMDSSKDGIGAVLLQDGRPVEYASTSLTCDVPDARLLRIREATEIDDEMQTLKETVMNDWPEQKHETPLGIRQYFDFRDTLSYSDGLMLKGEAVIIPKSMRNEMKTRLHKAHFGYDSMLRRARGTNHRDEC